MAIGGDTTGWRLQRDDDGTSVDVHVSKVRDPLDGLDGKRVVIHGVLTTANWVERGRSPMLPLDKIAALRFAIVIMPVATLFSATAAMQRYLAEIRRAGTPLALLDDATDFGEFGELMNLSAFRSFEERGSGPGE